MTETEKQTCRERERKRRERERERERDVHTNRDIYYTLLDNDSPSFIAAKVYYKTQRFCL